MKLPLAHLLSFLVGGAVATLALRLSSIAASAGGSATDSPTALSSPSADVTARRLAELQRELAANREKVRQAELILYRDQVNQSSRDRAYSTYDSAKKPPRLSDPVWAQMAARLGIPIEQAEAVRSALDNYMKLAQERRFALYRGLPDPHPEAPSWEQTLATVLTPAQLQAYSGYRAENRQRCIDAEVQAQMHRTIDAVPLDFDQQEQVRALYAANLAAYLVEDGPAIRVTHNARAIAERMRQILLPEQYKLWAEANNL